MVKDPGLLKRLWIEFDLPVGSVSPAPDGTVSLDGGDRVEHFLLHGVGVTGYDLRDCLRLIEAAVGGGHLPPVRAIEIHPDLSARSFEWGKIGVPVWRGVWHPWVYPHRPAAPNEFPGP